MALYRYYPIPCDRTGFLWVATQIGGIAILEFGPMGTTNFATRHMGNKASIYTSHVDDSILTFGDSNKLMESIEEIAKKNIRNIYIMQSTSSAIIGFDIESFCIEAKKQFNINIIPINLSGLSEDYRHGIEFAMLNLIELFSKESCNKDNSFNILGSVMDDYMVEANIDNIKDLFLNTFGYSLNIAFPYNISIKDIENITKAKFNIVIREEALSIAKYLERHYNMPYITNPFIGKENILKGISDSSEFIENKIDDEYIKKSLASIKFNFNTSKNILLVGYPSQVDAIKRTLRNDFGYNIIDSFYWIKTTKQSEKDYSESKVRDLISTKKYDLVFGNSSILDLKELKNSVKFPTIRPYSTPRLNNYSYNSVAGFKGLDCLSNILKTI